MSSKLEIFMTGVTGYIGGAVLEAFLNHPKISAFNIKALIRDASKADKLKAFGIIPVVGSLSDLELIEKCASQTDVFIAMANADDFPATQATLRGLKRRYEATGKQPIFINTSGTGVLSVFPPQKSSEIYDDSNPDQIETLPPTQPHRDVDLEIVAADKQGYVKTYIILPSTIFGLATGKIFDANLANKRSQQVPNAIKASLARGQGGMVGDGSGLWPCVEIHEVASLFTLVFDKIQSGSDIGHGREGFYFGANGEFRWYDVSKRIAEILVEIGRGQSPVPTSFTEAEMKKIPALSSLGTQSRCVANHSYSIGWAPKKTTADFFDSIRPDVDSLVAEGF